MSLKPTLLTILGLARVASDIPTQKVLVRRMVYPVTGQYQRTRLLCRQLGVHSLLESAVVPQLRYCIEAFRRCSLIELSTCHRWRSRRCRVGDSYARRGRVFRSGCQCRSQSRFQVQQLALVLQCMRLVLPALWSVRQC